MNKKFGNIIYSEELVNHNNVGYVNYYKNITLDELKKIDVTLPTLYVGWEYLKEGLNIKNVSILDKEIKPNHMYWEAAFNENKNDHINGVNDFINTCPNYYFKSNYRYVDLNPIFFNIGTLEELFHILPNKIEKSYFYINKMLYLLCNEKITGIDLEQYAFFNFNVEEIIDRIRLMSDEFINDDDSKFFNEYNKLLNYYFNLKRYMVTIL